MHYLNLQNISSKIKNNKILVNDSIQYFNLLHTKQKFNGQFALYKKKSQGRKKKTRKAKREKENNKIVNLFF